MSAKSLSLGGGALEGRNGGGWQTGGNAEGLGSNLYGWQKGKTQTGCSVAATCSKELKMLFLNSFRSGTINAWAVLCGGCAQRLNRIEKEGWEIITKRPTLPFMRFALMHHDLTLQPIHFPVSDS